MRPSQNFSYEMIFLIALNAEPVEFRVKPANALKNGQVARFTKGFANHFGLHKPQVTPLSSQG